MLNGNAIVRRIITGTDVSSENAGYTFPILAYMIIMTSV